MLFVDINSLSLLTQWCIFLFFGFTISAWPLLHWLAFHCLPDCLFSSWLLVWLGIVYLTACYLLCCLRPAWLFVVCFVCWLSVCILFIWLSFAWLFVYLPVYCWYLPDHLSFTWLLYNDYLVLYCLSGCHLFVCLFGCILMIFAWSNVVYLVVYCLLGCYILIIWSYIVYLADIFLFVSQTAVSKRHSHFRLKQRWANFRWKNESVNENLPLLNGR